MEINELKNELKKYLKDDEKRYAHSIGTMKMCEKLSTFYGENVEKAKRIGLMHDLAKNMSDEEKLDYVDKNNIDATELERYLCGILHGKIAADICKKKYGFDDEMVRAVAIHTTGDINMTMLQKILFVADVIEETRNYNDVDYYRKLAFDNIDQAMIEILEYIIDDCIQKRKIIIEKTIQTRNFLLINAKK